MSEQAKPPPTETFKPKVMEVTEHDKRLHEFRQESASLAVSIVNLRRTEEDARAQREHLEKRWRDLQVIQEGFELSKSLINQSKA